MSNASIWATSFRDLLAAEEERCVKDVDEDKWRSWREMSDLVWDLPEAVIPL